MIVPTNSHYYNVCHKSLFRPMDGSVLPHVAVRCRRSDASAPSDDERRSGASWQGRVGRGFRHKKGPQTMQDGPPSDGYVGL